MNKTTLTHRFTKRLPLVLIATLLAVLALAGALALLGARGSGLPVAHAQGDPTRYAAAPTRYVAAAPTGNDAGDCTDFNNPCRTVQYAVDRAGAGDEIRVATGTYTDVNNCGGLAQVVYISKTVTLRGGYSTDFNNWDPDTYATTLDAQSNGRVLYVTGDITPTVEGFRITGGSANGLGGNPFGDDAGGGIYILDATVTISGNTVVGNVANTDGWADGMGGGVYLRQSDALIVSNIITGNDGTTSSGMWPSGGWGGGLCAEGGALILRGNEILNNQAAVGGWFSGGYGGGMAFIESHHTVEANQIRENQAGGSLGTGGGVEVDGCPDFAFVNNVIADNQADSGGCGIYVGRMSGVPSNGRLLHTTIASNQGGAGTAGVRVVGGSVVTLTNTILVKHDTGINVSFDCTATLTATLWGSGPWANGADWGDVGTIYTGTINIWGDPAFLDPATGDYHIGSSSAAKDQGVTTGVGTDLDGTPRDANPDLGAYEASVLKILQVVKAASATLLNPGDTVTYTIVVTNADTVAVTNVTLTDTLPALQRPSNVTADSGTCTIADAGYGGRATCDLGTLGGNQAAHITITAQVTTTVPTILPQTMRNTVLVAGDQAPQKSAYADTILQNCHARVNGLAPTYGIVQAAVDAASAGDAVWIAGTCLGAFERAGLFQQVYLSKSLTLRGGYSTDFAAWDPDVYTTTLDAEGQGRVVYVTGPVNVAVETSRLTGGNANGLGGSSIPFNDVGGGVYAITATVTLSGTHVAGNVASTDFSGFGGGVGVISVTLTLIETTLSDNIASSAGFGIGHGGGLSGEFSTIRLERSRLENNVASGGGMLPGFGGGAYFYGSDLEASATLWLSNTVSTSFDWGQGGGLYVDGTRPFTLTNGARADSGARAATGESGGGRGVEGAPGVRPPPTTARNRAGGGIMADDTATVAITNAIIAGHSVGIRVIGNSTVTVNGVLWHDNISDTDTVAGTILVNNDLTGDPAFAADGYHLTDASDAIDAGVDTGVTDDIDGQPRQMGPAPDAGADEHPYYADLSLSKVRQGSGPVLAGTSITFTLTVSNSAASEWPAEALLVDTFSPAAAVFNLNADALPGDTCQTGGAVVTCTLSSVLTDTARTVTITVVTTATYSGVLTNTATVTPTDAVDPDGSDNTAGPITVTIHPCTALDDVVIAGPPTTTVGIAATFTATVSPPTTTLPVTCTWEATEQADVVHTGGGLSDTVDFTWNVTGAKTVTVTAVNKCGVVSATHAITVEAVPDDGDGVPDFVEDGAPNGGDGNDHRLPPRPPRDGRPPSQALCRAHVALGSPPRAKPP
nr:DUF11 domain-containing protein [Ardenticatenia bacterium]